MTTCFGISDHHLAILQELKLNFSKFLYDGQMMLGNTETCRHQNKDNYN